MGRPSRALTVTRSAVGTRLGDSAGAEDRRQRVGDLARPGIVRGDARNGEQPEVLRLRLAFADRRDPGAVGQPADRPPDAVPGIDPSPAEAAETVRGVFGGRPRPRFGGAPAASSPTSRSWRPSWTSMWTNRLPSGEGSGAEPTPPPGSPCSRSPLGQDDPIVAIGGQPDDLEPAVGIGHEEQRPVGQPAGARHRRFARRPRPRSSPVATSTRAICDVSSIPGPRRAMTAMRVPSGDHSNASTSTPVSVRTVGSRRLGLGRRPAAARDRGVDQPDLRPAAAARQEGEAMAVGRPARLAAGAGLADHPGQARPVGFDDPDLVVADEGEAPPVGRPLRVGDGLLRGGELGRVAAAQRQGEELPRAGGLGGEGDDPVARMEPELARRVDRDDRLDRQVGRRRDRCGRHQRAAPETTQFARPTAR